MNARQALPEFTLDLDRPRKIVLGMKGVNKLEAYFQEQTGQRSIWKAFDWRNLSSRDCTYIVWAALLQDAEDHGEELSVDKVEQILTVYDLLENQPLIFKLVDDLLERAMPVFEHDDTQAVIANLEKKRERAEKLAEKTRASTGSSSLALPS